MSRALAVVPPLRVVKSGTMRRMAAPTGDPTPVRSVRLDKRTWTATKTYAAANGLTTTDVIRAALVEYLGLTEDGTDSK